MSETLLQVIRLIEEGQVQISEHGYEELVEDKILVREVIMHVSNAVVVEDYPTFHKGPAVLVLQRDSEDEPIHVVWGIPRGASSPAVLITAYRPDPKRWSKDFKRRI